MASFEVNKVLQCAGCREANKLEVLPRYSQEQPWVWRQSDRDYFPFIHILLYLTVIIPSYIVIVDLSLERWLKIYSLEYRRRFVRYKG